jgi:L-fuculose-phosphate aldolase
VDEARLREAIVAAGQRLGARGLISAGEGNFSFRLPGDRLLVTPSGHRKDELAAADLIVVALDRPIGGDPPGPDGQSPTSDIAIHRALHHRRPDVAAVVHAHLPASMALTLAGEEPDPMALPETALFLPTLPLVPYAEMGSEELARRIAHAMSQGQPPPGAALLERHGAVAVGESRGPDDALALAEAVNRLELVEVLCRVWRDALLVRAARRLLGPEDDRR